MRVVSIEEGFLDGLTTTDGAMISEQHDLVVHTEVACQPLLLAGLNDDALVVVVGDVTDKARLLT